MADWNGGEAPMLCVDRLVKRYGDHTVIDDLSFSVASGTNVALSGPSGSGKTTLINILSGIDQAYGGTAACSAAHPVTVFQEPRLFPYMTVEENVLLPLKIRREPCTAAVRQRYNAWMDVCGLSGYQKRYPYQLSGGMKQRVALIRGFVTEPDLVMMDEPFKSIDDHTKSVILQYMRCVCSGTTLLFTTHSMEEARMLGDAMLVFEGPQLSDYVMVDM